jgi:endonuclease I
MKKIIHLFLLSSTLVGLVLHISSRTTFTQASTPEKLLSINIEDFYYLQTIPTSFTTGSTTGTDVSGNIISTCQIPVTGRLGHVSGDLTNGFRFNESTLKFTVSMGSFYMVGLGGQVYTTTARSFRINNVNVGPSFNADTSNVAKTISRVDFASPYTGDVIIQGSGSIGFLELIIYYTETLPTASSSSSSSLPPSSTSPTSYSYAYTDGIFEGYYASIDGVTDANLLTSLTAILRSILDGSSLLPTNVTYGNARYAIDDYDQDPNNSNNVILVYSQNSVSGVWDDGKTWNREHVFPQSLMGVETANSSRHKGADYHNLKPENPSVNTSRGNKYFAETTTTTSFAPPVSVRGDLARILFYMVTMWPELSLVDVVGTDEPSIYQMAQFSLLVKWHTEDPVDNFEAKRNDVIYNLQGNRNPYVDHPVLVCRIWGDANPTTQTYCPA